MILPFVSSEALCQCCEWQLDGEQSGTLNALQQCGSSLGNLKMVMRIPTYKLDRCTKMALVLLLCMHRGVYWLVENPSQSLAVA